MIFRPYKFSLSNYSPWENFARLNFEQLLLYENISRSKISQTTVHGPVHSYLPNLGKDHTLLGLAEVSVQTTARRIATCCSFLLDNLLFSNVIRFLDTAIFLLEDFISYWLDWQRDLAAKQSANLSISYTRTERRRVKG